MTLDELKAAHQRYLTASHGPDRAMARAELDRYTSQMVGDLIAAVEALREARDRERNPFDDGQTERFFRWSAILKRLGVE